MGRNGYSREILIAVLPPHTAPPLDLEVGLQELFTKSTSPIHTMSKSKAKRKQQAQQDGTFAKKAKSSPIITPPPDGGEPKTLQSVGLHEDDLDMAIDTLNALAQNPSVIKSKACKELRTAVYEFRQACTTGFNASGLPPISN